MKETILSPTHSFFIEDVFRYGSIEKALIMKEIKNMAVYRLRINKDPWVYYSASALSEKFPYMKGSSIKRWLKELEIDGFLKSRIRNKIKYDRTKSFFPTELEDLIDDHTMDQKLKSVGQNDQSTSQVDQSTSQVDPTIPSLSNPLSSPQSKKIPPHNPPRECVSQKTSNAQVSQRDEAEVDTKGLEANTSKAHHSDRGPKRKTQSAPVPPPPWMAPQDWSDLLEVRKKAKAINTERALKAYIKELNKAHEHGWSSRNLVDEIANRGWRGFKYEWLEEARRRHPKIDPRNDPSSPEYFPD